MIRHAVIASWACLSGLSFAQTPQAPQHNIRILAIGDQPPFIQQVRDGVRYEVAPPVESVPPRTVIIPAEVKPGGAADKSKEMKLRLRLGQISPLLTIPQPDSRQVQLETETGSKWLGLPLHSCGSSLAIVWRNGANWNQGTATVLPDDPASHAEGNVHFTNVSGSPVGLTYGKEKIRINPGVTYSRQVSQGTTVPAEISYFTAGGGVALCHTASLEGTRGIYRRIVIYKADGKDPRCPIKVIQLDEPSMGTAPQPPIAASTR